MLGKVAVDKKPNEIRALPALLEMLDIEGAVVTADAMHTQRDAAERITGKGGDCVLTLKGNQGSLHKDAKDWLEDPPPPGMRRKWLRISKLAEGTDSRRRAPRRSATTSVRCRMPTNGRVSRRSERSSRSASRKG